MQRFVFSLYLGMRYVVVVMSSMMQRLTEEPTNTFALTTATAAAGGALGILFGRNMEKRPATATAASLLVLGAVLAAPAFAAMVTRVANRPTSERGSRKRLEGIRNGSVPHEGAEIYSLDEEFN